jgi:hypothetical protein
VICGIPPLFRAYFAAPGFVPDFQALPALTNRNKAPSQTGHIWRTGCATTRFTAETGGRPVAATPSGSLPGKGEEDFDVGF